MTALKQGFSDLKLIVSTDHRVWAAAGFVVVVAFVWLVTGAWREPDPEVPEKMVPVLVKPEKVDNMLKGLSTQIKEAREERQFLRDAITRMNHEIEVEKEQIDWHANTLITRLNDVSEKVDKVVNLVGEQSIDKARLDEKLKKQKKKQKGKRQLDSSDYQ